MVYICYTSESGICSLYKLMYIVESYPLAVFYCFITMLCRGSWANSQKLATKSWRTSLYYWDYTLGLVLTALLLGLTLGSNGQGGRSFVQDLLQADISSYTSALLGGVIFNLSNLLIVAAIDMAGMAVAFPLAVGIALVLGVVLNFVAYGTGDAGLLFVGVGLVCLAILLSAAAYRRLSSAQGVGSTKGIVVAILSGVVMVFFYRFVADSMSFDFYSPEAGKFTSYSAVFIFSLGAFVSNFVWNSYFMYFPIKGPAASYGD